MLPTDLLIHRYNGEEVVPKRLPINQGNLAIATDLITLFRATEGTSRGELNRQLQELEGENTDYRIKRGLAHLLHSAFSTFEVISPLDPQILRQRVFALSAETVPSIQATQVTFNQLANTLTQELGHEVILEQIKTGLYADFPDQQILTNFETPTPGSGSFLPSESDPPQRPSQRSGRV